MAVAERQIVQRPLSEIFPYQKNAKKHPDKQIAQIAASIKEFGFNQPIVVDKAGIIIVGHGRFWAAQKLDLETAPIIVVDLTEEQAMAYRLADNKLNESPWEMDLVMEELKLLTDDLLNLTGFTKLDMERHEWKKMEKTSLQDDFIIPPFSIFDTRRDYWMKRRERWTEFFGDSREGREEGVLSPALSRLAKITGDDSFNGTSEFDPVLAEIGYKWFCPTGGKILDPFAGGVVRGAVAGTLGYHYTGIDLSEKQIETNTAQIAAIGTDITEPTYIQGDSGDVIPTLTEQYDLIFSCPPYFDLDVYSDKANDLSNAGDYQKFIVAYKDIIAKAVARLKPNRFAVFTVGDVRDGKGFYHGFVNDTIDAFESAGAHLYNDIILVNSLATAGVRARKQMQNRKVVKVHQNVLAFFKGDPKEIDNAYINLPKVERIHQNVVVFFKGDVEQIKADYKVINTGLDI